VGTFELLGPLEREIMDLLWERREATVRQVLDVLQARRSVAYTTVMTIMSNLARKGLLKRIPQGKAYLYEVALTRDAFLARKSQEAVSDLLARFGDLAVARFVEVVSHLTPEEMERLRRLAKRPGETPAKEDAR